MIKGSECTGMHLHVSVKLGRITPKNLVLAASVCLNLLFL